MHEQEDVFRAKKKPKNPIKFKLQLNEEQKQAKSVILHSPITVITGAAGSGKAQPLDALIQTRSGPIEMGSISVGDKLLTPCNEEAIVIGVFPQGEEDVYKVTFSDTTSTECSLPHLWNVRPTKDGYLKEYKTLPLSKIKEDLEKGKKYSIPINSPIEYNESDLKIHPYLMGVLISEGYLGQVNASFSTSDDFVLEKVRLLLPKTDSLNKCSDKWSYRIVRSKKNNEKSSVQKALIEYGLVGKLAISKFIPDEYKYGSIEQRVLLLQGLFDGDGYVPKQNGKNIQYHTSSERLKDDVIEIINSLGGTVKVSKKNPTYTYNGVKKTSENISYTISVKIIGFELVSLPRKKDLLKPIKKYMPTRVIDKIEYVGRKQTQCIAIDSDEKLYMTNNYIVTHNTLLATATGLDLLFTKEVEKLVITRPAVLAGEDLGFLPGDIQEKMDPWIQPIYQNFYALYGKEAIEKEIAEGRIQILPMGYVRGITFVDSFVIADEVQNLTDNQMQALLGRLGRGSKMVLCGDVSQIDLKNKKQSGLPFLKKVSMSVDEVKMVCLQTNHRHDVVEKILAVYKTYED
jgi:phosphate starvation-inducible protein PhoH